jgi:hypothetical protein
MYAGPLYEGFPGRPLEYASTFLACVSIIVIAPIYVFYKKGPAIRNKSKFAQSVNETWQKSKEKRASVQGRPSEGGATDFKAGIDEEKKENASHNV